MNDPLDDDLAEPAPQRRRKPVDPVAHAAKRLSRSLELFGEQPALHATLSYRAAANKLVDRGRAQIRFAGPGLTQLTIAPTARMFRGTTRE